MNYDDVDEVPRAQSRTLVEWVAPLEHHLKLLLIGPLLAAALGFGATYVVEPTFTASTTLLPPEKPQTASAAALQSLGALAGLGGIGGAKTTTDQFAALLQSVTVQDRLIDAFSLQQVYRKEYRVDTRREFGRHVRVIIGKKDGLLTIEVDDPDPQRAAALANQHVAELRRLTSTLAVTEAQQRRAFFEIQLKDAQHKLTAAQQALQASGFSPGALKAEPRAAADAYARMRAEVTAAQVRLQTLRGAMSDSAVEVQQQVAQLAALQTQLTRLEQSTPGQGDADYVGKYREFKYQETVLELMARNYELARIDESREGALIQVVDVATPPEKRSKPSRLLYTGSALVGAAALLLAWIYLRDGWRRAKSVAAARTLPLRPVSGSMTTD